MTFYLVNCDVCKPRVVKFGRGGHDLNIVPTAPLRSKRSTKEPDTEKLDHDSIIECEVRPLSDFATLHQARN